MPDSLSEIILFFANCSLTQKLSREEGEAIAKIVVPKIFKIKNVIIWEGVKDDKMYFVKSGKVVVSKKVRGDIEEVLARFGPGDFFGELALVEQCSRTATVSAEEDSVLLILESKKLMELEKESPQVVSKFYRALLVEIGRRLLKTTEKLQEAIVWGIEASSLDEKELL